MYNKNARISTTISALFGFCLA